MTTQPVSYLSGKVSFSNVPQQRTGGSGAGSVADRAIKDARMVNCFVESLKSGSGGTAQEYVVSRPGLDYVFTSPGSLPRGIYYWEGSVFTVTNDQLYKDGVSIQTLSTFLGPLGFTEFINSTNQKQLVVLDGTSGWVVDTAGTVTKITSANFPTPHVVYGVFLDGYLVVAKADTGDIYNSDLDTPFNWTAGNFISAEMYPDNVLALVKSANYFVAFGAQTIEYFYDAGAAIGTPFARNTSAYHKVGTTSAYAISTFEEKIVFVGNAALGGRTIFMLDGFKLVDIATQPVRRMLEIEGQLSQSYLQEIIAFTVRTKGHAFYVVNLRGQRRTMVYDISENLWHEWKNAQGTDDFYGDYCTDHPSGNAYVMLRSLAVCKFNDDSGIDQESLGVSNPITVSATSSNLDYGTMNRKFANRFTFVCDIPAPNGTASITLEWSDDDYQTWSAQRTVTISNVMNTMAQLGVFRRRAWRFTYNSPYPFRLEGAEVLYNQGSA